MKIMKEKEYEDKRYGKILKQVKDYRKKGKEDKESD